MPALSDLLLFLLSLRTRIFVCPTTLLLLPPASLLLKSASFNLLSCLEAFLLATLGSLDPSPLFRSIEFAAALEIRDL
jgi:hypothetical protein